MIWKCVKIQLKNPKHTFRYRRGSPKLVVILVPDPESCQVRRITGGRGICERAEVGCIGKTNRVCARYSEGSLGKEHLEYLGY